VLLRHTQVYARIAAEARHPDYLADAARRDRLLDHYWNAYDPVALPGAVVQSEIEQAWSGDIPYFHTRSDRRSLAGHRRVAARFFPATGFARMRQRIRDASEADLQRHVQVIRRSLAIFEGQGDTPQPLPAFTRTLAKAPSRAALVAAARTIGNDILDNAFGSGRDISWIDINVGRRGEWDQTVKVAGLYDGTDGIAIFFAHLARATGARRFGVVAEALVAQAARALRRITQPVAPLLAGRISPFVFPGSVAYAAEHLVALGLRVERHETLRRGYVDWVGQQLRNDRTYDLLEGACGAIPFLLDLAARYRDRRAAALAVRCGEHLCRAAVRTKAGVAWTGPRFALLGGLAHGTAAYAWVLQRLAEETGRRDFATIAGAALAHDRALYVPALEGWQDLRHSEPAALAAWCHGSAGIALGRLLYRRYAPAEQIEEELARAAAHISSAGFGISHCLCHGQLGNIDILAAMANALADRPLRKRVGTHLMLLLRAARAGTRWRCGMSQRHVDFHGFFMGLSGIGYTLLRFAFTGPLPNVLALELPERP
jgi:type 2 lantibiotic biosynthesis protein LanM